MRLFIKIYMNYGFKLFLLFNIFIIIIEISEVSNFTLFAQENEDILDKENQSDNDLLVTINAAILGIRRTILGNYTELFPRYAALMD